MSDTSNDNKNSASQIGTTNEDATVEEVLRQKMMENTLDEDNKTFNPHKFNNQSEFHNSIRSGRM